MFVLDSHCDTPSQILRLRNLALDNDHSHVDFPKLRRGGVDGAFFALYVPASLDAIQAEEYAWKLINALRTTVSANPDRAAFARSADEALQNRSEGRFSVFVGLENGSPIGESFGKLDDFHEAGVRYVTLCHSADNLICDSCASKTPTWGGLSPFGRRLVQRMNDIGMMIDVSHISDDSFHDVIRYSRMPVVATHSCCRALADHPRNMTDDMIRALASNGGVIQINFYPVFIETDFSRTLSESGLMDEGDRVEAEFIASPGDPHRRKAWNDIQDRLQSLPRPSYKRVVDHIDHAVSLVGVDHVGLGSDFDGISVTPEGLEDISKFPILFEEMRSRGYSEAEIEKIAGGNFLRVMSLIQNDIR
ncbi:MAG: dipeptidase [Candidatus Cryptobacteroides sp.]